MTNTLVAPLPPGYALVLQALDGVTEGVTVRVLAGETDLAEHTVRRILLALKRTGWVARKRGIATSPNMNPPYVYTRTQKEQEIPTMPRMSDPDLDEEQGSGQDEAGGDVAADEGDAPPVEDPGYQPPSLPGPQPMQKAPLGAAARGVVEVLQKREVQEAEQHTQKLLGHKVGGTRRIQRIDPIPANFPEEEKGNLGHAVELSVVGPIEDYIRETYGGGTFLVHSCDHAGEPYGGRPLRVEISGLPKPQTDEGRLWLEARKAKYGTAQGAGQMQGMELMQYMDRKSAEARREAEESMQKFIALMKPTGPDPQAVEHQRIQYQTQLDGLKASHLAELVLVRSDAERRVQDATKAFEKQTEVLKEQITHLRADLEKAQTKAVADLKELRVDLERQQDREVVALKERQAQAITALEKATDDRVEWLTKMSKLESDMAINKAKPQDFQTKVQSHMARDIADIAIAEARRAAGLTEEDEGPETMMDALKGAVLEAGPDVLRRVAGSIMSIVEQRSGVGTAEAVPQRPAIAQRPIAPPRRPGTFPVRPIRPPAPPAAGASRPASPPGGSALLRDRWAPAVPPPAPPLQMTEEEQAASIARGSPATRLPEGIAVTPVTAGEDPPPEGQEPGSELTPVQQATALRLQTFFEVLFTEMQIDSEAAAVWTVPIPGADMTFEDLYFKLPGSARKAMEAAEPEKAWEAVLAALGVAPADDPLLEAIQDHLDANPKSHAWLTEFFEAGPWNQEEEDEEPENEEQAGGLSPAVEPS
jgi:hypothetical protein